MSHREITISQAFVTFRSAKTADGCKPRTVSWYEEQSLPLLRKYGDRSIASVTTDDLRALIIEIRQASKSAVTATDKIIVLHVVWKWIAAEYNIQNPMGRIKWPKREQQLPKAPSTAHVKSVLVGMTRGMPDTAARNVAMLTLCIDTGMRIGELLRLAIDDVDFAAHQINVRNTKGGAERVVPFSKGAEDVLTIWLKIRPKVAVLFCTLDGKELSYKGARQVLRSAHKRAGLEKHYGWHSYRHYAARHYRLQSADIFDVQKLLGHKQISTTVGAYGNYIPDDLSDKHERHTALNTLLEQKGI